MLKNGSNKILNLLNSKFYAVRVSKSENFGLTELAQMLVLSKLSLNLILFRKLHVYINLYANYLWQMSRLMSK